MRIPGHCDMQFEKFGKFSKNSLKSVNNPSLVKSKLLHSQLGPKCAIFNLSLCERQGTMTPVWSHHDRFLNYLYLVKNRTYECFSVSFSKSVDGNKLETRCIRAMVLSHFDHNCITVLLEKWPKLSFFYKETPKILAHPARLSTRW